QILNLSFNEVFKTYSGIYKIFRDVYQKGLISLEIRDIPANLAETVQKIVLKEKQICYKLKSPGKKELNLFVPGSIWDFKELSRKILASGNEDLGYKIINVIKNYEEYDTRSFFAGKKEFPLNKVYVMGILNVTPDSFSDGGKFINTNDAVDHAVKMIEQGADIIDIGGESTRPGAQSISAEEEIERILPVIEDVLRLKKDTIISVDTTKSKVAEAALTAGAVILNDISGGNFDPAILDVVKKYGASFIAMHIKGTPVDMQKNPQYENLISEVYDFLFNSTLKAARKGIKNIIVDPGIGFGKTIEHNFELIKRLEDFKSLGFPIMIGVSRKSFLGKSLNVNVNELDTATSIMESVSIKNGARFIRTHNVLNGVQTAKLLTNTI